ncbi:MAG: Gfo/Idh/MocA family oxidoreductase [Steroidobacteraceae bacterium]|nr:Gfo/Idh/MocA family oxidoreductase [Steroidobacteraceae bacterium]
MSETLRVALLGGGKMALQHATAIRLCRAVELVAVADPQVSLAELTARFGADVRTYSDLQAMLTETRPHVVHIVTPPDSHSTLAKQCLASGASVYVEKPFALTSHDAQSVLELARTHGLRSCAAHQLLFHDAGRRYRESLPIVGDVVHVESFFSFRPVRRRIGGSGLSEPVDQLIDILPHPVYLLLDALPKAFGAAAELTALDVSCAGEVRAVVRRGGAMGCLTVSLRARPVESWLRVMGTNGMVEADFVLGTIIRHPGPGASAPAVVLKPFSRAWQTGWGSFKAVLKLIYRRHRSYPGLAELLDEFYRSIREGRDPPTSPSEILDTVRLCEEISARLHADKAAADARALTELRAAEMQLPPLNDRGVVLVTGGTGLLGRPTVAGLRNAGWRVRVPVRRELAPAERLPGVEYVRADLGDSVPGGLLDGVEIVLHLAAETAGRLPDHERNTVAATRHLLDAMSASGVRRLVNVSSVAVLKPSRFGRQLREDSPVDHGNLRRGPYVWAKAAAERLASECASAGAIELRTVRLGPLVDFDAFAPPGRLGREVARLFVAMGLPSSDLAVCGVGTAASAMRHYVEHFATTPPVVNLLETPALARRDLVARLRHVRPDLKVMWLPFSVLRVLSWSATALQKLLHPSRPALNLYGAFKSERYDAAVVRTLRLGHPAAAGRTL